MVQLPFRDRTEAGRLLAAELTKRKLPPDTIVLALPRGGVPIGFAVANALGVPLDVVIVRKLGVPWQPEFAMGAIAGKSQVMLDDALIGELGIRRSEVEKIVLQERAELVRRERLYRQGRPAPDLKRRTVILVDDGLATGSTMRVAARSVRSQHPKRLLAAVPVASASACRTIGTEVDECICLAQPEPFDAVGQWYVDFHQVTDAEVQDLLHESMSAGPISQ